VFQSGFQSGAFFSMASAAPFLMTEYLGRSSTEFGVYFLLFPFGYCFGNWISSRLSGRVAVETMVLAGTLLFAVTVIGQAAFVLLSPLAPMMIFIPGFLISVAQGLSLPNAQAGAIRIAPSLAGTAAGIGVFLQMFCGALFSQIYGLIADGTPYPMIWTVSASTALASFAGIYVYVTRSEAKIPVPA
jgi:DHA1 family bicyclomycin/chloramphenicol resistance-like MFS transporter